MRVWATGRAWSYSFATEKMISKLGYSWRKVDSRFSNKFVSSPLSGRKIETPGTDSGGAEVLGDLGRGGRYLRRLEGAKAQLVSACTLYHDAEGTDAAYTPTSWMSQWTVYHPRQPMDR